MAQIPERGARRKSAHGRSACHGRLRWLVLGLLFFSPWVALAQGRTVAQIVTNLRQHGYASPTAEIRALQSASDVPPAGASAEAKRVYFSNLGILASAANDGANLQRALEGLESAAKEDACRPCGAQATMLKAGWELTRKGATSTIAMLAKAESEMGPSPPDDVVAQLHATRARNHRLSGNPAKAIKDALEVLRLADKAGIPAWRVEANITLALSNASLGDFPRADKYIQDAIAEAEKIGYGYQVAYGYLNLGHMHALRGAREAQRTALNTALRLSEGNPDLAEVRMISLSNLADYHLGLQEYTQALDFALQAGNLARSLDEQRSLGVALVNEGIALAHLGQVDEGIARVKEAIAIAKRMENREHVIGMTHELIGIYERDGRYKEAVSALHEVAGYEKELTKQERQRDVLALQEEFATERKEQEIARLSAVNARQQAMVEARNAQRWMWVAVALALAMAAGVLFNRLRGVRSANKQLSRVNEALEEQTSRDPLTGTYNRRHFQALISRAGAGLTRQDQRKPQPFLSLVVLDLDHFKHINDTWGHEAGDAVLVDVANRLRGLLRNEDAVVRWGGEEFVLVLPSTAPDGVCTLVGRVLEAIGRTPVVFRDIRIPVTVSAGGATIPENGARTWRYALQVADLALYRAKAGGRNRAVCVSGLDDTDIADGVIDLSEMEAQGSVDIRHVAGPASP